MDWLDTIRRSHAVMLVAKHLVSRQQLAADCQNYFNIEGWQVISIEPEANKIGIDTIRRLYRSTSYRNKDKQTLAVLINEAQKMSQAAQNAFLKLLEEPPGGVKFILLCPDVHSVISTIRSRCQQVTFSASTETKFMSEFNNLSELGVKQLYLASGGDILQARVILSDSPQGVNSIKTLLQHSLGEALLEVSQINSNKEAVASVVEDLTRLAHSGVRYAKNNMKKSTWLKRLDAGLKAKEQLAIKSNSKMVLDNLLLEFWR